MARLGGQCAPEVDNSQSIWSVAVAAAAAAAAVAEVAVATQ